MVAGAARGAAVGVWGHVVTQLAYVPEPNGYGIIKLAVLAVGGQGGGVLTGWIEDLARANGYDCQATSVAGVAQRTGSTVYYVEMCPHSPHQMQLGGPVFSLMPAAGDVDIMISAEMMEAGRAIQRGFVTPDRTVLITSTHRALAVSEKTVPGDGIADASEVMAAAGIAARGLIAADFEALAVAAGSVISASLFGGLAASGALPFAKAAFEAAIAAGGKGVAGSLRAFEAGYGAVISPAVAPAPVAKQAAVGPTGPARLLALWAALAARTDAMPLPLRAMTLAGLRKVVDFQDCAYGADYLDRVDAMLRLDRADQDYALSVAAAKHLANAMAYDDVIRVADLKVRATRFARIRAEMGVGDAQALRLTEYLHPRAEEIAGLLPARLGARLAASPVWMARVGRWFGRGRHLRSDGLTSYGLLYVIGGMKFSRRGSWRHATEVAHLEQWLDVVRTHVARDYDLAVEVVNCRRLIKGYSDTHARGLSKFDLVMGGIGLIATRPDAADWARRLREAALRDEEGTALQGALATIRSFV